MYIYLSKTLNFRQIPIIRPYSDYSFSGTISVRHPYSVIHNTGTIIPVKELHLHWARSHTYLQLYVPRL